MYRYQILCRVRICLLQNTEALTRSKDTKAVAAIGVDSATILFDFFRCTTHATTDVFYKLEGSIIEELQGSYPLLRLRWGFIVVLFLQFFNQLGILIVILLFRQIGTHDRGHTPLSRLSVHVGSEGTDCYGVSFDCELGARWQTVRVRTEYG